jgi:hypothetical protein
MPIPTLITDLSQTAGSNFPAGPESPSVLDDVQRAHAGFIAQLRDGKGQSTPLTLASATTTDIGGQNSQFVEISGSATITSFGTNYTGIRYLRFTGTPLLTHNATTLNINGSVNVTAVADDTAIAIPNQALNGWNVYYYRGANAPDITTLGNVTVPTQTAGNSSGLIASTAFVTTALTTVTQIQTISGSVASNALTIGAGVLTLGFRSTTLTSGTISTVVGTPSNLVVPSGATLGTVSGVASSLVVLALNNAGTIELAVINLSGGNDLSETGLISTTAISTGADSANVFYSTTARTNVAYRVIGRIDSTQATAGTWATTPTLIQGAGGQALTAMPSLGYGQTWQNVIGSRTSGTTYYNTTGRPIQLSVAVDGTPQIQFTITVAGSQITAGNNYTGGAEQRQTHNPIVPPGASYVVTATFGTITHWYELR